MKKITTAHFRAHLYKYLNELPVELYIRDKKVALVVQVDASVVQDNTKNTVKPVQDVQVKENKPVQVADTVVQDVQVKPLNTVKEVKEAINDDFKLCKHGAKLGLCKHGCK